MTAPQPEPPQNVVAVMPDGQRIAVECLYLGRDEDGLHLWQAVGVLPGLPDHVSIDELPPLTSVVMGFGRA